MTQLPSSRPSWKSLRQLSSWQNEIDAIPNYPDQVSEGKTKFSQRNIAANATFADVRNALRRMCCGAQRCGYCEDSTAVEVEHMWPKDLYPDRVFAWSNYLYACGGCNRPKGSKFAVFVGQTANIADVGRNPRDPVTPPQKGDPVLIDPRREDPTTFLFLDLKNTFYYQPSATLGPRDYQRARYTIDLCGLNLRSLPMARREALNNYRARVIEYRVHRDNGKSVKFLQHLSRSIMRMAHQTVWLEMKRQRNFYASLTNLFNDVPEALSWT